LKQFYSTCKKHNVEIILISSDKSVQSFNEYFTTMPWLSLPMSEGSLPYASLLSSKLSIRSIPQLVVLDLSGGYVTNNAKSQVANLRKDTASYTEMILSWKKAQSVPIEEMNRGIMGSVFSKAKQSYDYVVGKDAPTRDMEGKDQIDSNDAESTAITNSDRYSLIAYTILSFFKEATVRLKEHPTDDNQKYFLRPLEDSTNYDYIVPVSLEDQRQFLLKVQLRALEDAVSKISEEKATSITANEIREHLRALGTKDFANITDDEEVRSELLDQMNDMNENARMAFARSVLWSETRWTQHEQKLNSGILDYTHTRRKLHQKGDGMSMERETILEFCGLCNAVVKLAEVETHLQSGKRVFGSDKVEEEFLVHDRSTAPQRVLQLQQMMLCAVGFEPTFGGEELHRVMMRDLSDERDEELEGSLASFLMTMQVAAKKAMDEGLNEGFSDKNEGGVTKVISVKYSEKTVKRNTNGEEVEVGDVAPSYARMEQRSEEQEREQLKMAARAATLQRSILDELYSMEEHDREKKLVNAKMTHQFFVQKTMALPPGPERVAYLQSVSSEQQHLLLMHKLWESRKESAS
jgi:hypothetical protein